MQPMLVAFAVSVVFTLLLVRSAKVHAHRSGDRDFSKPQKFHAVAVPRIGGLSIVLALICACLVIGYEHGAPSGRLGLLLMLCAAPAFLAGFVQDLTEAVTPRGRLVATAVSAALAFHFMDAAIRYTAIPGLDWLVGFWFGSLVLTVFAVAGIANALNIIDGFNGLASMCAMLMLAAIAYVGFQVDDSLIALLSLAGIGAVLGFFLWNFPSGLIFLGDGGAYFLGFFVAEVSILLLVRNPEVSPIFPLLVCIYPVFETLFSIYRRWFLRQQPAHMPDGIHLHSLVYRRVMRWAVGDRSVQALTKRNSRTSPVLWALCMCSIVPAMAFWDSTVTLGAFLLVFALLYLGLYWGIVRFRSPRLLLMLGPRRAKPDACDNRRK
ncbi:MULTISPECIES: glycosyltransferase [unclassified Rubrivivax]|uniref:MraY family glycosyltransferase n=1 Tax=unclassified Rubrivivax TaxID=2649762 RepID=UPI001E2A8AF0|nr:MULTISPECIES: glycosyltransferase [unclassified Rubrivivax]MCC9595488.1 glycosyltransferase [Rubrivivax sp. JA1055]MCC9647005.1 glycosyltransferase [Rubrivivax sp. JA1029]